MSWMSFRKYWICACVTVMNRALCYWFSGGHWRSLHKVCTELLPELKMDLHLPIPTDISCPCRAQSLSGPLSIGVCRRSWGWVAAARQVLTGPSIFGLATFVHAMSRMSHEDIRTTLLLHVEPPVSATPVLPQTAALKRSQYLHVPHTQPTGRF